MVKVIQTAGGTQIHSLFCKTSVCLASINMFPQLGVSAGTPSPIKLNPASATMYVASNRVACTITVVITFGNKCFMITLDGLQPMEVAASIYSFSFSARILLRTIRATPPQPKKPKTRIRLHIPVTLPNCSIIAFKTITKTMNGRVNTKSVTRINTLSIQPPKYPAIDPKTEPIKVTKNMETKPIVIDTLPPYNVLVNISLPFLSVPSQCSLEGSRLVSVKFTLKTSRSEERRVGQECI